jgi:hypothetical protein
MKRGNSCQNFIVLLLPFLICCNYSKPKRTDNIVPYLNKVQHVIMSDDSIYHLVLLQNGMCGACDFSQIKFIQGLNEKQIIIVLQMPDSLIVGQLAALPNVKLFIDSNYNLEKYGLSFTKSTYFIVRKNAVVYHNQLTEENYASIAEKVRDN